MNNINAMLAKAGAQFTNYLEEATQEEFKAGNSTTTTVDWLQIMSQRPDGPCGECTNCVVGNRCFHLYTPIIPDAFIRNPTCVTAICNFTASLQIPPALWVDHISALFGSYNGYYTVHVDEKAMIWDWCPVKLFFASDETIISGNLGQFWINQRLWFQDVICTPVPAGETRTIYERRREHFRFLATVLTSHYPREAVSWANA